MQRGPQITLLETVSEVPDEVAHGDWLKTFATLAQHGLDFSLALARELAGTPVEVERTIRHSAHSTTMKICRIGPCKPPLDCLTLKQFVELSA